MKGFGREARRKPAKGSTSSSDTSPSEAQRGVGFASRETQVSLRGLYLLLMPLPHVNTPRFSEKYLTIRKFGYLRLSNKQILNGVY
jgi:hypothetical protein